MDFKWINQYLHTRYIGCIKGSYEKGCPLYLKDINNFIQNAGRYANLEIIRMADEDILLNTCGTYIDYIWPEMSLDMRRSSDTIEMTDYIAEQLGVLREKEGYFPEPLPKVKRFMKEVFGQEIVDQNAQLLKAVKEEILEEEMKMEMKAP